MTGVVYLILSIRWDFTECLRGFVDGLNFGVYRYQLMNETVMDTVEEAILSESIREILGVELVGGLIEMVREGADSDLEDKLMRAAAAALAIEQEVGSSDE
jgi:hypothetical protein